MALQTTHELHNFMRRITREMSEDYEVIRKRTPEDPGTAGDQGEEHWAELLRGWIPRTFTVETKGKIIGHNGRTSPQVDVIVLKDVYPKKWLGQKLYLAAGVAAAFECKSTLRPHHITKAIQTSVAIKNLFPIRRGTPYKELHAPILYGLLAHSHDWKQPGSTPDANVTKNLRASDETYVEHPRQALDLVCVADLATWTSSIMTFMGPNQVPSGFPRLADVYGKDGSAVSYYVKNAGLTSTPDNPFTPIGAFIAHLSQKLAWENPGLRDLADYYRMVDLQGGGGGEGRHWPASIYSADVRPRVEAEPLPMGVDWDEWCGFFF